MELVGAAGVAWIGLVISSHKVGAGVCMGYRVLGEVMAYWGEGVLGTGVTHLGGERAIWWWIVGFGIVGAVRVASSGGVGVGVCRCSGGTGWGWLVSVG